MRYYLFRLQKQVADQLSQKKTIEIDFLPPDCANAQNGDCIIVYVSETLQILGTYTLNKLILTQTQPITDATVRDIWTNFECVQTVTDKTSRLFKKKMREITQIEYEAVLSQLRLR